MSQEFNIVGNLLLKVDGAEAGLNKLKNSLSKLEIPKGLENSFKKSFSNLDDIFARYRKQLEKGFDTKGDVSNITKIGKELDVELTKVSNHLTKLTGEKVDLKVDTQKVTQATADLEKLLEQKRQLGQEALKINIDTNKDGINNIKTVLQEFQRVVGDTKAGNAVGNALFHLDLGDLPKALNYLREAEANLGRIGDKKRKAFDDTGFTLESALAKVITELTQTEGKFDGVISKEKIFKEALSNAQGEQLNIVNDILAKLAPNYEKAAAGAREAARASEDYAKSTLNMKNQMEQLQQSTQYFFSLRNMINLLKRGINEAIESVKELDAAMTETAVVTDFSVGDMWEKLPEYTKNANALGASVVDMYKATTLYYQQGLNTEQSMSIAAETMKMARIGSLEAADATDKMTAALRGFNMEINEASAQRVNDVYSNLAAKTASDTKELGTAMQRTASIAASAGMSFEGTAAFLAQAIETTREPAENLGTAMKTIVARFTELKKNPLEIAEVDGEEVSYNKVDAALQSIGVSLKDTNGQFRDLDQVFLDISQRWDSLSQTQQRYIATIAAGSRQQSRFIAMMSNYDRTVQLMDYANNSAGASNEQFGKTMESLEAKLNKLKNAWQQFEMGIANNSFVKGVVDGLTGFLNITNKVIDTLSLGSGVIKSFLSVFAAFTGLKAAGRFANAMIGGLGGLVDPQKSFAGGFTNGFTGNRQAVNAAQAHAISDPIVRAIYAAADKEIQAENRQSQKTGAYAERDAFSAARRDLLGYTKRGKEYSLSQFQNTLSGLSVNNQSVLMRGNAGTAYNITQGVLNKYYKQIGNDKAAKQAIKQAERSLNTARAKGEITWSQYFDAISDPMLMKKAIDRTRNTTGIKAAETALDSLNNNIKQAAGRKAFSETAQKIQRDILSAYSEQGISSELADQYLATEKTQAYIKSEAEKARQAAEAEAAKMNVTAKNGIVAAALNTLGRAGTKASEAGMSLQAFASILTSSANPALQTFGSILSTFGGLLTGLGMGVSGLSSTFTAVAESSAMVSMFGGAAATATGWIFAAIAAITAFVAIMKKHNQNIRDEAEKVTTNFKERSEKNQTNISNLKEWQEELAILSKGVDKNGLNVSLDSNDYQRYLEITQGIADINPEIIQGYNSQGHAIIDNNKALQETLTLEQQYGAELAENYTNIESWGKLLKARNLERVSMLSAVDDTKIDKAGNYGVIGEELKPRNQMRTEARRLALELKNASPFIDINDIVDLNALSNGSISEFNNFRQNFDIIKHRISLAIDEAGEDWSERSRNAIIDGLSGFSEASGELDTLVQPIYEMMSTYATSSVGFEHMADPLKTGFQQVLKNIAEEGTYEDPAAMQAAVDKQLGIFSKFSKDYEQIEKDITKAQREFADSQDEAAYQAAIQIDDGPIEKLKELKAEFQDVPGGSALAEWIDNQIDRIEKRTIDGTTSISEAWDTLSDEVTAAEGAYNVFAESIKSDYSTAADSMKQIYETATAETDDMQLHLQGFGDKTAWRAAEELFGDVSGWDHNDLKQAFEDIGPLMQDGQAGVEGFVKRVLDYNTGLEELAKNSKGALELDDNGFLAKIDDTLDPDIWSKVAETLGISEQLLVSMIQKSKQFFEIDTSNYDQLRTALGNDITTIKGSKTTTYTDNEGVEHKNAAIYYMTDNDLRELMGAEYSSKADDKITELRAKGIEVLPDITKASIDNLGKTLKAGFDFSLKDQSAGIASLVDTFGAKYDSDSILKMAQAYFGKGEEDEAFNEQVLDAYDHFWENQDYPTLGPVQNIESLVAQIASSMNRDEIQSGNLNDALKQGAELKEAIFGKEGVNDSIANFFRKGLDESGKALTQESYGQNLAELSKLQASTETYLDDLRTGMAQAVKDGNEAQVREYSKEIQGVEEYQAALVRAIEAGKQKFEEGESESSKSSESSTTTNPTTGNPNPYDAEEEALYSRNTGRFKEWLNKLGEEVEAKTAENSNTTENKNLSVKDGGTGFQGDVEETTSALSDASENLTGAGDSLTTAADEFVSAINTLATAGESLNTAAFNLTTAASVIVNNPSTNGPTNGSSTIPGIPQAAQPNQSSVSGTIVIDNSAALNSLDEVYQKATETAEKINEGATFSVRVHDGGLSKAGKNAKKITDASGDKNINVTATTNGLEDVQTLTQAVKDFNALGDDKVSLSVSVSGVTSVSSAITAVKEFYKLDNDTVTVTTIHKNEYPGKAKGSNNHGSFSAPSFGSAAGGYGQVGPKGKGGLTLTGELGYEIAWIPSENRSMILGANGPQMVNLPGDAVVWTHEQSKKILKQKSIPAGSNVGGTEGSVTIKDPFNIVNNVKGTGSTDININIQTDNKKPSGSASKPSKPVAEAATSVKAVAGKVSVWWENMARKVEATERKIDRTQKTFENHLQKFGQSAEGMGKFTTQYKKNLERSKYLNDLEVTKAKTELRALNNSKKYSRQKISYEVTKTTTDKKGKKKETKETRNKTVSLSNYIKKQNGTYVIDQKAISRVADKNKSMAEAIRDAAEKEINDRLTKQHTAEDKIYEARESLKKLSDDVYTTFYQWEFSLNKVYFLSQKLSDLSNQMSYQESKESLLSSQVSAGYGGEPKNNINKLVKVLEEEKSLMISQVNTNLANVEASKQAYKDSLNYATYVKKYSKNSDSQAATADLKAAKWALKFVKEGGNFNEKTIESLRGKGYSEDTINRIKEIIEDINQKRTDAENAATEGLNSVRAMYDQLNEYQEYISSFESDLLSGLEEQTEKEIDRLDKLNSSLSKAFKDLLDEVKTKLDERRKQEDNQKTELDIAKKQQRLAALRADTSGGHQVEIAQLEQEVAEAQKNYQRTLEDQLIEKLQHQGDEAEKQRERQIELLNAQKEIAQATGTNLAQVQQWLKEWQDNNDSQAYQNIRSAWLSNHGYDEATADQKAQLERQFDEAFMKYGAYTKEVDSLKEAITTNSLLSDATTKIDNIYKAIIKGQKVTGWKAFKEGKGTATQAKKLGASAKQLKNAGYSNKEIFDAGYSKDQLKKAGITVKKLKDANVSAKALKARGYAASTLKKNGYKLKDLIKAGYSYGTLLKLGYTDDEIKKEGNASLALQIGVPNEKILDWYKDSKAIRGGMSGKVAQQISGTSLTRAQKIVNKKKGDKATQASLAGMKTKIDVNGKEKGGIRTATVNASGRAVTARQDSTLYSQSIQTKGKNAGKTTGKVTKITIGKLTKADFAQNKQQATNALISAIRNSEVGSKINEQMKSLVAAAGIAGKTYKLKNGLTGSVGSNGKIYYNDGKAGVQIWDAATGNLTLDKYNKKDFIKKAKKKSTISREYAQVLKKNGVTKGYATGGLATETGPAWLDGTPSKPELVLNARDTKNFIALKDVLAKAMDGMGDTSNTYGDIMYEININVDKIEKDYDVDRVVDKVKKEIIKGAGYRNVTQVRNFK